MIDAIRSKDTEVPFDRNLQRLLVIIVAFNIMPHILTVPIWVTALCFGALVWKWLYLSRGLSLPKRRYLNSLAILAGFGIFVQYRTIIGQEPASSLLVVLASLKLVETNRYRDAMLVIFTGYFLLMAHLLDSQSLLSTVYMGVDVLLITALIFHAHKRDRRNSIRSFRPIMRLLTIAFPVWIFLFIAFPRFTTMFWNAKTLSASSGFSDKMNPGSIEKIIGDERTAFRVRFKDGALPSSQMLYWRGAILTVADGLQWQRLAAAHQDIFPESPDNASDNMSDSAGEKSVDYDVWLEPGFQKWLFELDFPKSIDAGDRMRLQEIHRTAGLTYEAGREILSRMFYHATSVNETREQVLRQHERATFLQVPKEIDAETSKLAADFKKSAEDPVDISDNILKWFHDQHFHYSSSPGALKAHTGAAQLSEFLFQKRLGFCEHYAAAYATLMRLAGIPARVVIGFQGGQVNEFGHYFLIRSVDAHAWTEIWIDNEKNLDQPSSRGHWTRVDPTSVIAPMRLVLGGDFNRIDPGLARGLSEDELRERIQTDSGKFNREFGSFWDALQMKWNAFLISYDFDYQVSLLGLLGFTHGLLTIMLLGLFGGLFIFAIGIFWVLRRRALTEDPALMEWRRFCRTLQKDGIERGVNEGPLNFSKRAAHLRPDRAGEIAQIAQTYMSLRYGLSEEFDRNEFQKFRQSVRGFSIKPSSRETSS
jgi:protein-glutamine gamma-glutamyltransferase